METLFLRACKNGSYIQASFLMFFVDVNVKNECGDNGLSLSIANNHPEIVYLLLNNGACINSVHRIYSSVAYDKYRDTMFPMLVSKGLSISEHTLSNIIAKDDAYALDLIMKYGGKFHWKERYECESLLSKCNPDSEVAKVVAKYGDKLWKPKYQLDV